MDSDNGQCDSSRYLAESIPRGRFCGRIKPFLSWPPSEFAPLGCSSLFFQTLYLQQPKTSFERHLIIISYHRTFYSHHDREQQLCSSENQESDQSNTSLSGSRLLGDPDDDLENLASQHRSSEGMKTSDDLPTRTTSPQTPRSHHRGRSKT
jgi:hypothetical protein